MPTWNLDGPQSVFTKSGYLNRCPKVLNREEVLVYSKALETKQNKAL